MSDSGCVNDAMNDLRVVLKTVADLERSYLLGKSGSKLGVD